MIPTLRFEVRRRCKRPVLATGAVIAASLGVAGLASAGVATAAGNASGGPSAAAIASSCLPSGDGYLKARIAGAIDADIDWPNSGTACAGEPKTRPPGVRMSFRRTTAGRLDLLFVFGLSGVKEGQALRDGRANLTVIEQGSGRVFGTLGDGRCTVDSLSQRRLAAAHSYRIEVRGFCTQPARALRGNSDLLVSRFDFAGLVNYANE